MTIRRLPVRIVLTAAAVLAYGCSPRGLHVNPAYRTAADYEYHSPQEIFKIMGDSPIKYELVSDSSLADTCLASRGPVGPALSPNLITDGGSDSSLPSLTLYERKPEVDSILAAAGPFVSRQSVDTLIAMYHRALAIDTADFLVCTNLGDSYYLKEQYDSAEFYLKRAIDLNDIAYQPRFFLADVYLRQHRNQEALREIAYAFMLNRNHAGIAGRLDDFLDANGLTMKRERLCFPFSLTKKSARAMRLAFKKDEGVKWLALANCLACWTMEPSFNSLTQDRPDSLEFRILMYRECLAHQALVLMNQKEKGEALDARETQFVEMVNSGINAIIYWELMAPRFPAIITLLTPAAREKIVAYILRWVFGLPGVPIEPDEFPLDDLKTGRG